MKKNLLSKIFLLLCLIVIISIIWQIFVSWLNCNQSQQGYRKQGYSKYLGNKNLSIIEKKITQANEELRNVDFSTIRRSEQIGQEVEKDFDCEWVQQSSDGKQVEVCKIIDDRTYELRKTELTSFSSKYEVIIDGEVMAEKELSKLIGLTIQSIRLIGPYFVVDFQTDLDIRWMDRSDRLHEEYKDKDYVPEIYPFASGGTYSSIWVDGVDVLEESDYLEAFSPFEFGNNFGYFVKTKDDKTALVFDGEIIELEYLDIWHYGCCEDSALNILQDQDSIDFFAEKIDGWYHVEIMNQHK